MRLSSEIDLDSTFAVTEQLAYAQKDESVKAILLVVNSPGGSAALSEELYLEVLNSRQTMPVVATIDLLAASGGYYMAVAADEVYAKPTSGVGSIGVIASLPGQVYIEDEIVTTGPYKAFGGTRDGSIRQMEMAKFSFLEAVAAARGENLKVDLDYLSRAEIYTGVQAADMGLIDGLKSTEEAIDRAAEMAGLNTYDVVELFPLTFPELFIGLDVHDYQAPAVDADLLWATPLDLPTGIHYRYIDSSAIR